MTQQPQTHGLRPEADRKFASQRDDGFRLPVPVALNALAFTGLLRTMRRRNFNHQEAARVLLKETYRNS